MSQVLTQWETDSSGYHSLLLVWLSTDQVRPAPIVEGLSFSSESTDINVSPI